MMLRSTLRSLVPAGLASALALALPLQAQTLSDLRADPSPNRVLTYGMGYSNQRYSPLQRIDKRNVARLVPVWNYSLNNSQSQESQPVVYEGTMYVTTHTSTVAIDALTGRQVWKQDLEFASDVAKMACCGLLNRGVAILNGKIYRTTLDSNVIAYDAKTGKQLWKSQAADYKEGHAMTGAPLIANGVLMTGIAGGEYGTRGFIDGWDPETGKRLWRLYTTALPGEKGGDTWPGDTAQKGGAPTWLTGAYDPDLDLVYWGTGNGGPWNAEARKGDNLYVDSVLAFRPKTGELVWHYQFSPNDPFDYDSTEVGMLIDLKIDGTTRKVLAQANRNGFFYVLDRITGELLLAKPFVEQLTWASGVGPDGRPQVLSGAEPTPAGAKVCPAVEGATNWMSTAYNPETGLFYVMALEKCVIYSKSPAPWERGKSFYGGATREAHDEPGRKYLRAIEARTGKIVWQYQQTGPGNSWGGVLSTAGGIVFFGDDSGAIAAVEAKSGKLLEYFHTNEMWKASPMTYMASGKQYVAVAAGSNILAFGLP